MIARESIETFHDLRKEGELGRMQEAALSLVRLHPCRTARELAELGNHADPNAIRPRICELHEQGLIEPAGVRLCTVTGRGAATWRLKTYEPQGELFRED